MKKNAFTLVEIIATIVILSIIFLFTTPKIINLINDTNDKNKILIEEKLIQAGKEYISEYNKEFLKNFVDVGTTAYINSAELVDAGLIEEKEITNLGGNVSVKIELMENDVLQYTVYYN